MSTAIKLLLNLRALSRESIPLDQLQKALENLSQVVNERIAEDAQEKSTSKEREEKLEIYRQMLLSDGLSIEDLLSIQEKALKNLEQYAQPNINILMIINMRKHGQGKVAYQKY